MWQGMGSVGVVVPILCSMDLCVMAPQGEAVPQPSLRSSEDSVRQDDLGAWSAG
jgi:hypothetical protein